MKQLRRQEEYVDRCRHTLPRPPDSTDYSCCMLQLIAFDPYLELLGFAEPIAKGWNGIIGVDLTEVRAVVGINRAGWRGYGVSHGAERAAEAATNAFRQLNMLGASLEETDGAMVTISAGPELTLKEIRDVTRIWDLHAPRHNCDTVLAQNTTPDDHTYLSVEVIVTVVA